MERVTLGTLEAVIVEPVDGREAQRTVVLLHGFGAPGTDLVGLAGHLQSGRPTRFVFPQAPQLMEGATRPDEGRAWWHIDMMQLQVARMTRQDDLLAEMVPEGLQEARAGLDSCLSALVDRFRINWSDMYVGGFSQGAMLSCDWALRGEAVIAGLIQLSGTVICEKQWDTRLGQRPGFRIFQSHSPDDQVLPLSLAERLHDKFKRVDPDCELVSFRGGHGIAPDVMEALKSFIDR